MRLTIENSTLDDKGDQFVSISLAGPAASTLCRAA
jgi:hypothetical protein